MALKPRKPLPFFPSLLRPQGLCPGPLAKASQHRRWPPALHRDPWHRSPNLSSLAGSPLLGDWFWVSILPLGGVTCSGVGSWPTLTSACPTFPERSVRTQQIMSIYLALYIRKYVEIYPRNYVIKTTESKILWTVVVTCKTFGGNCLDTQWYPWLQPTHIFSISIL